MGTESEGFWAERSWLFIALCRQLGVDAGLVTYTRGNILEPRLPKAAGDGQDGAGLLGMSRPPKPPIAWLCTALIDGKAYLFDARVGLPVPGPGGEGVATLDQAMADPAILDRMNLPGQSPYGTSRASLLSSPTRIGILIDSSQGLFSPRMSLLQRELPGKNRTILYRDPAEQRDHFAQVLGDHLGSVRLWEIPLEVETRLFTDSQFVESTMQSLFLFRPDFPLVFARIKQLRGELAEAVQEYVSFRLNPNVTLVNDKKKVIPKPVQEGMDVYATYYLALAHLERKDLDKAEKMFQHLLRMLPEPGPTQPYYDMFRWGAQREPGTDLRGQGGPPSGHRALHPARSHDAVPRQPAACPRAGLGRPDGAGTRSASPRPRDLPGGRAMRPAADSACTSRTDRQAGKLQDTGRTPKMARILGITRVWAMAGLARMIRSSGIHVPSRCAMVPAAWVGMPPGFRFAPDLCR